MPVPATPENAQDLARVRAFVESHEWHFAKTMSEIPHWYCLLKDKGDVEEFRWFAAYIREHSMPGRFYGKTYYYFRLDGYKYWWMDPTVEECDLINRDEDKMYVAPDGIVYASYKAYCNDPDLDIDLIQTKLGSGAHTPQNDFEKKLLEDIKEAMRQSKFFEIFPN